MFEFHAKESKDTIQPRKINGWNLCYFFIFSCFFLECKICIIHCIRKHKFRSVGSRFPPFSNPPSLFQKFKNNSWILSKTYYSTRNFKLYPLVINFWLINALITKTKQLFSVAFSLSGGVWVHNSGQHYRIITRRVSIESCIKVRNFFSKIWRQKLGKNIFLI